MPGPGAGAPLLRRRLEFLDGWLVPGLCRWHGAVSGTVGPDLGFLVTYSLTRWITRRIRARSAGQQAQQGDSAIKDVYIGGVHIHHQVWGMLLVLVTGLLEFRFRPGSPWQEVLAALFGAGAALMLDEFALSLYLKDVYWTREGRKSIDAVMVASAIGLALLLGT